MLGWEFWFLVLISGTPIVSGIPIPFLIPKILVGKNVFWNSNVWRVRKSEFRFVILGIPVICLRRNSVHLIVANLYWLQSMYNDLILMVHKLVAPLQHQTADQHHVISWHHQCDSCHWPAILDRWCNQCYWCASGKKQGRYWARYFHPFSAPCNQCATTTWSWQSCREVEYDRHLLHLPRGMQIYSYWDGDDAKDGNTCSLWWSSADKSKIQDVAVPKDVDQHGDSIDQFKSSPPCQLQWSGNWHVCFFQYNHLIQMICTSFAVWLSILFCLILIVWLITTNICL